MSTANSGGPVQGSSVLGRSQQLPIALPLGVAFLKGTTCVI